MAKDSTNQGQGGGLLGPIIQLAAPLVGLFSRIGQRRRDASARLPQWLSPADFRDQNRAADIILITGALVVILVLAALIYLAKKK